MKDLRTGFLMGPDANEEVLPEMRSSEHIKGTQENKFLFFPPQVTNPTFESKTFDPEGFASWNASDSVDFLFTREVSVWKFIPCWVLLRMVFVAVAFSPAVVSRGNSPVVMHGLRIVAAPLVAEQRLRTHILSKSVCHSDPEECALGSML
ncbi:hypothetical protein MG293_008063 [Ovis ammon polii]|uniref:Uncharacterized protein n=1 Tax=Ovis ammon polii TaxID=230172 RepID=A0AAD4U7T7_OVIAM|nr:hypothetical protein MG293_008063 [Ovis ammon polii]